MRVICPYCYQKALITSTSQLSQTVKDLYCACSNTAQCGATFVFTLAHKHDLNPPRQTTVQIAASLIKNLSDHERKTLQISLFD